VGAVGAAEIAFGTNCVVTPAVIIPQQILIEPLPSNRFSVLLGFLPPVVRKVTIEATL
jgi:hypothetical protein